MSDTNETLSAILAEMRLDADILVFPTLTPDKLRTYADRIEADVARERNAHTNDIHDALYKATGIPGNATALREALKESTALLAVVRGDEYEESITRQIDRNTDALAARARNCDVGTAEEQAERHGRFCAAHYKADAVDAQCFGCPASDKEETDCEFVWGQLPFATAEGCAK